MEVLPKISALDVPVAVRFPSNNMPTLPLVVSKTMFVNSMQQVLQRTTDQYQIVVIKVEKLEQI